MKISSINTIKFTGRELPYSSAYGENGLRNMSGFYKNSTIENTVGSHHTEYRNKAYFADPMEEVNDKIKDRVDFVVYDNEPSYPKLDGIKKNYLETNRVNYANDFDEIRQYYYRREMGGFANVNEAKYQQWQAAECINLYNKAGHLRYRKETTEDEVKALEGERANLQAGLENTLKELKAQEELKQSLEEHINNLKSVQKPYEELQKISDKEIANENVLYSTAISRIKSAQGKEIYKKSIEDTAYYNEGSEAYPHDGIKYAKYEDTTKTYDSLYKAMDDSYGLGKTKAGIKKKANILQKTIANFESILEDNSKTIDEMQSYTKELKGKLSVNEYNIKSRNKFIKECKEKLAPLFDELAEFYKKQGIKVIKG